MLTQFDTLQEKDIEESALDAKKRRRLGIAISVPPAFRYNLTSQHRNMRQPAAPDLADPNSAQHLRSCLAWQRAKVCVLACREGPLASGSDRGKGQTETPWLPTGSGITLGQDPSCHQQHSSQSAGDSTSRGRDMLSEPCAALPFLCVCKPLSIRGCSVHAIQQQFVMFSTTLLNTAVVCRLGTTAMFVNAYCETPSLT